jgi:succinyl-diaminopimelate desuccinylase
MIQEQLVNLTMDLVRIASVTTDQQKCKQVLDVIAAIFADIPQARVDFLQDAGVHSLIIKNFDGKRADVCFNAHVDVVPPQDGSQFEPYIDWDLMYGRGAGDMKDGVAIISLLMKELINQPKKLMLMLTADEEIGGDHGVKYLVDQGYGADIVLIPDGGNLHEIVIGEKGVLNITLTATGKAGHSSRPWKYENAIEKLYQTYTKIKTAIETSELHHEPNHRGCSVQLTTMQWGQASNMIPGEATGTLNIRFTEVTSQEEIMKKISSLCEEVGGVNYELAMAGGVLYTDPSHPILQQYLSLANTYIWDCSFTKEHGASDGRFFAEKGSIVILQKPTCYDIHGREERTTVSEFEKIYGLYKEFVASL